MAWAFPEWIRTQASLSTSLTAPLSLRIISHNIRYATTAPFPNELPWSYRAPLVLNQLEHETRFITVSPTAVTPDQSAQQAYSAAFICLQEVLHTQLIDIMAGLNHVSVNGTNGIPPQGPYWSYSGVGRDDGVTAGEYSPIIYPTQLFKPLRCDTAWLSPTPGKPSRGWDAASIRILTICIFEHKMTGRKLIAANTHLDDQGEISRQKSVGLIQEILKTWRQRWSDDGSEGIGTFLAGDFNSKPDDMAYQSMNWSGYVVDSYYAVGDKKRYGNEITFTGFEPAEHSEDVGRIDFIWLSSSKSASRIRDLGPSSAIRQTDQGSWRAIGYAVLPNVFDDGVFLSDHRAVVVDASLHA